jgi:hypothetical protein
MSSYAMQQNFDAVRDINAIRAKVNGMFNPLVTHINDVKEDKVQGIQALNQLLQIFHNEHKQLNSCRDNLLFWQGKEDNLDGRVKLVLVSVMEMVTNLTELLNEAIAQVQTLANMANDIEMVKTYVEMDLSATAPSSNRVQ